jgi:hypothetical protein
MRGQNRTTTTTAINNNNIMDDHDDDDDDDDDDTVVGNCLHCNAPPPPRSSEDSDLDSAAAATRVQVSCDDCRSFICDGAYLLFQSAVSSLCRTSCVSRRYLALTFSKFNLLWASNLYLLFSSPLHHLHIQSKGCHWCHEFQANHEIRVCDRCDAFYCRGCDEMDQCEDCSEVVCNTCSTLMSCKFCGCGLCEDCATACGR